MTPFFKKLHRELRRMFEAATVAHDVKTAIDVAKMLVPMEEALAAEEAAAAAAASAGRSTELTVRRVIVGVRDGWEQHLTPDERAQLDALRASAERRASDSARSP